MIDLHMHTNYSDGTNTCTEILKKAQDKRIFLQFLLDRNMFLCYSTQYLSTERSIFLCPSVQIQGGMRRQA